MELGHMFPSDCTQCGSPYSSVWTEEGFVACLPNPETHLVAYPMELPNCSSFLPPFFVCDAQYYYSAQTATCRPCVSPDMVTPCSFGYYHERCQSPEQDVATVCKPCAHPALPNAISYAYGPQRTIPKCATGLTKYPADESCALFLTPSWDRHECELYCNVGYTNVNPLADQSPDCKPCLEVCGLGFACAYISPEYRLCTPCVELNGGHALPAHARWLPTCAWECVEGYYTSLDDPLKCVPCLTDQRCWDPLQRYMGCAGESPGRCTPVDFAACVPNSTYLYYEVYSQEGACAPCARPVLNVSYMVSECTQVENTRLRPCSAQCARSSSSSSSSSFITRECTLTSDIQCQPCTVGALGQLMVEPCGVRSDARFVPCPEGGACDGSATVLPCAVPKIPRQGVCVCPPGMRQSDENECLPLPCPSGWYPNASIDACSPCYASSSTSSSSLSADLLATTFVTVPMRMGLDACGCAPGYFRLLALNGTLVECWPCGDLMCTPGLQAQSECEAIMDEPQCLCQLPPGTRLLDQDTCAFACASEYDVSPLGADMTPGWWSLTRSSSSSHVSAFFGAADLSHQNVGAPLLHHAKTLHDYDAVLVAPDLAVLSQPLSVLQIVYQNQTYALNASTMLMQGSRLRLLQGYRLQLWADPPAAAEARFWIGFSFEATMCGGGSVGGTMPCSTVELVQIFREGSCAALKRNCFWTEARDCDTVPLCVSLLATGIWGNTMQAGFTTGLILDMTGNDDTSMLYLLLSSGCVHAYPVHYYAPETRATERADDSLQNTSLCTFTTSASSSAHSALAYVGDTLFIPGQSKGLVENVFVPPVHAQSLMRLTATRWLLMRVSSTVLLVVDVWNGVSWPLSSGASFSLLAFHSASSSTLWQWPHPNQSAVLVSLHTLPSPLPFFACPLDTVHRTGSSGCTPMQCVKTRNACGNNSLRLVGTTHCVCLPGYYDRQAGCTVCPANAYCPGLDVATPIGCGANALSVPGATTVADCMCKAGHYPFQPNVCLPCPLGFWCLGARTLPIPCMNSGVTFSPGASSPLDCVCPPRSYGLLCTPCAEHELCLLAPAQSQPQWSAQRILGWGPASLRISDCLDRLRLNAAVYSIPGPMVPTMQNASAAVVVSWGWMLAVLVDGSTNAPLLLTQCLHTQGFVLAEPIAAVAGPQAHRTFAKRQPCASNEEWSGDELQQACTCIEGYVLRVSSISGFQRCMPCRNGSIRIRRAPPTACVPCPDNNSHAPWMAMSHCVCLDGYYLDMDSQACTPNPPSFLASHAWLTSYPAMLSLSIVSGLLCMLGCILAPHLSARSQ